MQKISRRTLNTDTWREFANCQRLAVVGIVALLLGCTPPARTPVVFDIAGQKLGDPLPADTDETIALGSESVKVCKTSINGKLEAVSLEFPALSYDAVSQAYKQKFGPPHRDVPGSMHWETSDGFFSLSVDYKTGKGNGSIASGRFMKHMEEKEKAQASELKGKL